MFELVNSLRSELMGLPLQPIPSSLNERMQVVKQVVNQLYKSAVPENQTEVLVSRSDALHYAAYAGLNEEISFSPLLLLASEEIPERFRFTGADDPRLNDRDLRSDYSNWICEKLEVPVPAYLSWLNKTNYYELCYDISKIKSNLLFMQDPQKAKNAIKFLLLHELGHFHQSDLRVRTIVDVLSKGVSISWPICVACALSWPLSFSIAFVLTAASASVVVFNLFNQFFLFRFQESRADAFAVNADPSAMDGGVYLLNTMQSENKRVAQERKDVFEKADFLGKELPMWLDEVMISSDGENRLDFSHPSLTSRISALEALKQQRVSSLASLSTRV